MTQFLVELLKQSVTAAVCIVVIYILLQKIIPKLLDNFREEMKEERAANTANVDKVVAQNKEVVGQIIAAQNSHVERIARAVDNLTQTFRT